MIRWQVAQKAVDTLRARAGLAGWVIDVGWPGDEAGNRTIWVDEIEGTLSIPHSRGTAGVTYDDRFTITVEVRLSGVTRAEVLAQIEHATLEIVGALQEDPTLGGFTSGRSHVIAATADDTIRNFGAQTPAGFLAAAQVSLNVHTRTDPPT